MALQPICAEIVFAMKTSSQRSTRTASRFTKADKPAVEPCTSPGHCPPDDPVTPKQVMPMRVTHALPSSQRSGPPETDRRAFEDAVNGWWWL